MQHRKSSAKITLKWPWRRRTSISAPQATRKMVETCPGQQNLQCCNCQYPVWDPLASAACPGTPRSGWAVGASAGRRSAGCGAGSATGTTLQKVSPGTAHCSGHLQQSLHFGLLSWSRHSHLEKRWLGWTGGCRMMDQLGRCDLFQCQRETTEPCQTEMEFAVLEMVGDFLSRPPGSG